MESASKVHAKTQNDKNINLISQSRNNGCCRSANSSVEKIMFLQRTAGNQAVQRLVKSGVLQARLKIGKPDDIYEHEADRVAEQVLSMPESEVRRQVKENKEEEPIQTKPIVDQITPLVQRPFEDKEEKEVQTKGNADKNPEINFDLESRIQNLKGGGQPLPNAFREFFEPRLGYNFSQVRVHTGIEAAETSHMLNAKAYTVGNNVVLGAGQYVPETLAGRRLLAHELTHVIQQNSLGVTIQKQKLTPFKEAEIRPLNTVYSDANRATHSCIGILNKTVKIIYKEELKNKKLRSTIQDTMKVLESSNLVDKPTIVEFLDSNGKETKGTRQPYKLSRSVEQFLMDSSVPLGGWYLYGLSIMDGYHSVLIAVHVTDKKKLYWLDQVIGFKEITGNLDSKIEKKTIIWWRLEANKGVKHKTRSIFWPFVRVLGDFSIPSERFA